MAARLQQVLRVDTRDRLAGLSLPMMYLRPCQDRLVPKTAARPFAQAGAQVTEIDGPHFVLQARPDASAKAILEFVTRQGW